MTAVPALPPPCSTPVELRRRAAALGGGGRAGRDGDAVDISASSSPPPRRPTTANSLSTQTTNPLTNGDRAPKQLYQNVIFPSFFLSGL